MHRYQAEITILEVRRLNAAKERVTDAFTENFLMPTAGLKQRSRRSTDPPQRELRSPTLLLWLTSIEFPCRRWFFGSKPFAAWRRAWDRLVTEQFEVQKAQRLLGVEADPPVEDLFPQRYVALAVTAFRRAELSEGELAKYLHAELLARSRGGVSASHP